MKKLFLTLATLVLSCTFALALFGCNTGTPADTIVVGASSTPHAEILEAVRGDLLAAGFRLKIVTYGDYILPNTALESGELDANYFQHTPYLDNFNAERKTHLSAAAKIHYEPFGVYGKEVTQEAFDTVKTGRTIYVPADGTNCTRALFVLRDEGYITLRAGVSPADALTDKDIAESNGNEVVLVAAEQVPVQLRNSAAGSLAVVNGNYALASGLNLKDALAVENAEGEAAQLYANVVAVKAGNENTEKTKALVGALTGKTALDFINATYGGAVLPVFAA